MKIGVDAMGGDFAPQAVVQGVVAAAHHLPADVSIVLVGKQQVIADLLTEMNYVGKQIEIASAEEIIDMGEHPALALKNKPNSSIGIGFGLLKAGSIDIFCSAGNTGAMLVGAMFSIRAFEGLPRPAIAGFVPQKSGGYAVMLDIGANADCKPEMLERFAVIGSIFTQYTFGLEKPRVALMNIGEEEQKGNILVQEAYKLLKINNKINFVGNIEGKDFFDDKADVIVTDGFTGNTMFKLAESFYTLITHRGLKDEMVDKMNYEAIGGTPLVGVNGNVMIAHGASSALAIQNMIGWARKQVEAQAYVHIAQALG